MAAGIQRSIGPCFTSLSRLLAEGRDEPLFVRTESSEGLLSVEVFDGASTWQGALCTEELEKLAELSKMSFGSFLDETKNALSGKSKEPSFAYSATCSEAGELQFAWKKLSGGIKFQLGSIALIPVPNETVNCHLLNHSLDYVNVLELKIGELREKCDRFMGERQVALERLHTCTSAQETIESEMYAKFKLILNEKKAKIRKLMESKSYLVEQNEEMQRQIWDMKKTQHATPVEELLEAVEEEEEEEQQQQDLNQQVKRRKPLSTTDLESLLCDVPLKPPSPPPTKRRQMNRGTRKGKVEIPQPPPLELHPASKMQHTDSKKNTEMSLDSSDLLDML